MRGELPRTPAFPARALPEMDLAGRDAPMTDDSSRQSPSADVIVLDDDEDTLALMEMALRGAGHGVRAFSSARAALSAIADSLPDIVVTDLRLSGGTSGSDLARSLRQDPSTSHVALIAVSGVVDPDWPVVRPFDAYLHKPIELDVLQRLVVELAWVARRAPRCGCS